VKAQLATASDRLADPWLFPLRVLPGISHQLAAADGLTTAASDTVSIALRGAETLNRLRDESPGSVIDRMADISAELNVMPADLRAIKVPNGDLLLGSIGRLRGQLVSDLVEAEVELSHYADLANALVAMSGVDGHWLVAAANTGEIGLGTGMPLALARASFNGGHAPAGHIG
jgi:hypothetical protein